MDQALVDRVRARLAERQPPENPPPLTAEELQHFVDRGNCRRPLPRNHSDNYKVNLVGAEDRWIGFCASLPTQPKWKDHIKTLSWENRGTVDGFLRYVMRRRRARIGTLSAVRVYLRELWALYCKYTGDCLSEKLKNHALSVAKLEIAPKFGLRVEPKKKNHLGPGGFTYLAHFRWVRDTTAFKVGLDRLDDALLRIFLMWTGCRRHELVLARSPNHRKKIERYDAESDAYTDIDNGSDDYVQKRPKTCWVCGRTDERTDAAYKVLCWEDIDLWILHDPEGDGGRDRLTMQVLLRFHKGHNKEIVPTWYPFVEEKLPVLCPISHLLAKALAEGAIRQDGYDRAEAFFHTKLSIRAVKVEWKTEFLHKLVFCKTVESFEGPTKSDEPLTAEAFDNNSDTLGKEAGLPDKLYSYDYRRGNLEVLDSTSPFPTRARKRLTRRQRIIASRCGTKARGTDPRAASTRDTITTPR